MSSVTAKPQTYKQILQQGQIYHSQPLDKEPFEFLLTTLSPLYLPMWDTYTILSENNLERYDAINRGRRKEVNWNDFMNETKAHYEEIRKELYFTLIMHLHKAVIEGEMTDEEYNKCKEDSNAVAHFMISQADEGRVEERERTIIGRLENNLIEDEKHEAVRIVKMLAKGRERKRKEFLEDEQRRIKIEQEEIDLKENARQRINDSRAENTPEKLRIKAHKRLHDLSFSAEAKYIYRHSNLDGISQEWLDEVKRQFEILEMDTSDENIVKEMVYLAEQTD